MSDWKIRRAPTIQTEIEVPGDKSISHRAVMLAAPQQWRRASSRGFLPSEDCLCTVAAMRALGIEIEIADDDDARRAWTPGRLYRTDTRRSIAATPAPPCACSRDLWPGSLSAAG